MNREARMYRTVGQQVTLHLYGWIHTQFPQNPYDVFNRMADYILAQDPEDVARLLEIGWWKVYDEMVASRK